MSRFRHLSLDDIDKGYFTLLSQLTEAPTPSEEKWFSRFRSTLCNSNHFIYVAEENDQIIATGTLFIEPKFIHHCGKVGHIEDIVIHQDYRGKHLGKALIDHLTKKAKTQKCYKVILNCDPQFKPFYQKCGYQHKGTEMTVYF